MKTKQSGEETLANVKALVEYLAAKNKQLVLIDEARKNSALADEMRANVKLIDAWMLANCTDEKSGETDYSFANLNKMVVALKRSLKWMPGKAPVENKVDVQTEGNKVSREIPDIVSRTKRVQEKQAEEAAAEDQRTLESVAGFIARHSGYPHSKIAREKADLRAEFERLKKAGTKPDAINRAIRKMMDSFPAYMGVIRR
jgi:hypothetical protein